MKVACGGCGRPFEAKRRTHKFCSDLCRVRSSRRGPVEVPPGGAPGVELGGPPDRVGLVQAYELALDEAGRLESPIGQLVMVLARKLAAAGYDTGSATAALSRELDRAFDKALRGVTRGDAVDEFTKRLRAKQGGGKPGAG